jgi:hypothetical protein
MAVAMEMSQPTYSLQPPMASEPDYSAHGTNSEVDDAYPTSSSIATTDPNFLSVPRRYADGMQNDTPSLPRRLTSASHGAYKLGRRLGDGTLAVVREAVNVITIASRTLFFCLLKYLIIVVGSVDANGAAVCAQDPAG